MIKSMTGFGRGESKDSERQFIVEVKSVNHRYNDIVVRMPKRFTYLEDQLKNLVKDYVKRGRVEVYVTLENIGDTDTKISVNTPVAEQYIDCLKKIRDEFNLIDDITVSLVSKFSDVIKIEPKEEDEDAIWSCLQDAASKALGLLVKMRAAEGLKLAEDISNRCVYIANIVDKIESRSPKVVLEYKQRLNDRIHELLDDNVEIDENRISMEVAVFADKCSITEEIVRLKSHVDQLKKTLEESNTVGRKLDFLIQEMNREINTIGSKSSDLEITNYVVDIKSELEKIREQVQNIE
ncbi:YicC/YloC family endoribonuclease [Crassaminicella profunda]|uniref:YicC/YloC family endoribonuclease n=1 Tax=Crassaminicella profunda TaxID=1286698 RepID=UPI001CA60049|nr:YicC/YloC family endoribonuclease [Crassaminicella profunda]QZY57131.1 YicC family protein [Crassaminicella profunda]